MILIATIRRRLAELQAEAVRLDTLLQREEPDRAGLLLARAAVGVDDAAATLQRHADTLAAILASEPPT